MTILISQPSVEVERARARPSLSIFAILEFEQRFIRENLDIQMTQEKFFWTFIFFEECVGPSLTFGLKIAKLATSPFLSQEKAWGWAKP